MVVASLVTNAGTWKIHNSYVGSKVYNVVDARDKVYYHNGKSLYRYDKATQSTVMLTPQNLLSDYTVDNIFYDSQKDLLFVAYENCNIDVIDGNGKVTNISNYGNANPRMRRYVVENGSLTEYTDWSISDITFLNGTACVATGVGYFLINESTMKITRYMELKDEVTVNSTALLGDLLLILTNASCYYGPVSSDDPINEFKKQKASSSAGGKMFPIDSHSTFVLGGSALYHFDFSGATPTVTTLVSAKPTNVQRTATGFIANFSGKNYYYTFDSSGKSPTKVSTQGGMVSSNPDGDGTVWIADADGLHTLNGSVIGELNAMTTDEPYWLKYNTATDLLYVGVSARNGIMHLYDLPANAINVYDGQTWADATAYKANGAGYEFVFNPMDSTTYLRASWNLGLHKVTNNVLKTTYSKSNSLMGTYKAHPAFDKQGNLWVVNSYKSKKDSVVYHGDSIPTPPVAMLSKEKVAKTKVTYNDWFMPSGLGFVYTGKMQRSRFVISKLNNAKIYTDGDFMDKGASGSILCWDNFSEDPTVDNYTLSSISSFTDQNNKLIKWVNLSHMEEDADGLIWTGHTAGLFVFNPSVVFDLNPKAIRPKVLSAPLNEDLGTLCEGCCVYDIAVDRDNNKWIATSNGLYFVSPDGTRIYEHYTTQTSDIPSDIVYSVECDPEHSRVYIYTQNGFAEYMDGEPAAIDYNNVIVYPNPVEPDFTGMVRIEGLMADSYVTITDHDGHTVAQMGPVTGTVLWDACDADGDRLPTGIYGIYASQGSIPVANNKPCATVMIIK